MMRKIVVNEVELFVSNLNINEIKDDSGKVLKELDFSIEVTGKSDFNLIKSLFKSKELGIYYPEKEIRFEGNVSNSASSYIGELDEKTKVSMNYKIKEINAEESAYPTDLELGARGINSIMYNWARTRALSEIMIENKLMTKEEYGEKIKTVMERDFEEFNEYFFSTDEEK